MRAVRKNLLATLLNNNSGAMPTALRGHGVVEHAQARPWAWHPIVILSCLLATFFGSFAFAAPPPNYDDATLRAVQFVDKNEGWAVGDVGVIWHTIDSGKTWERQPSGTRASLRAVKFLTPYTGWIVGRTELPNGAESSGTVLFTADGGASWKEINATSLPGLNAVQFLDESKGIAVGDGTNAFPSGAFTTSDSGRTWAMIPGPKVITWNAIDFKDLDNGTLWGDPTCGVVKSGKVVQAESPNNLPYRARAFARLGEDGFLAGGQFRELPVRLPSCDPASVKIDALPRLSITAIESLAVSASGPSLWSVGSPGSALDFRQDANGSWEHRFIGTPIPLQSIHMIDGMTGWVVGDMGVIRKTNDGGRTWTLQKAGAQKAAILFVHAHAEDVPLGTIASLAEKDGYHAVVHCTKRTSEPLLSSAVRAAGGTCSESSDKLSLYHVSIHEQTLDRLVLAIRTWRPDVLVTDLSSATSSAEAHRTAMHVKEAFDKAGDPTAFPNHGLLFGLAPHEVKKLYAVTNSPEGAITVEYTTYCPELLDSPKDFAEPAAMLLGTKIPDQQHFKLIASRIPGAESHKSLMEGIVLAEGGTARRKKSDTIHPPSLIATRETASKLRRQLDTLAATGDPEKVLPEIVAGIAKLPAESAARSANALAQTLADRGLWSAAREMYAFTAEHMPTHPETVDAIRWLIRYHGSSEVRRRIELGQGPIIQKTAFVPKTPEGVQQATHLSLGDVDQKMKFASSDALHQWHQMGLNLELKLATFGGAYTREPATHLALVAARRNLGLYADATRQLQILVPNEADAGNDWQGRMVDEIQLLTNKTVSTKTPLAECRLATERPTLDGKLDEACWSKSAMLSVPKDKLVGAYGTETRFAFDDKFLYVGVKCSHPERKAVPKVEKRERDAEMQNHDRVEILLDLDRDYQTYYRLRVDHRGCVAEDCWGDATWNPKWFVAVEPGPTGWTAEVAIPLAELSGLKPANGHVWAMDVVRIVPGVRSDSWGSPFAVEPKASGMGLMKFVK